MVHIWELPLSFFFFFFFPLYHLTIICSLLSLISAGALSAIGGTGREPTTSPRLCRQSPLLKKGWALAKASQQEHVN